MVLLFVMPLPVCWFATGHAPWGLSGLKAEECVIFCPSSFGVFFFFLVLAALTFFLSSSSAHRQGIHLRKLHLPAARAHEQACPRETFHSLAGWQRDTCVTERFYPYIFLCFSFNSFFSSWKTIANTRHLAVIAVR